MFPNTSIWRGAFVKIRRGSWWEPGLFFRGLIDWRPFDRCVHQESTQTPSSLHIQPSGGCHYQGHIQGCYVSVLRIQPYGGCHHQGHIQGCYVSVLRIQPYGGCHHQGHIQGCYVSVLPIQSSGGCPLLSHLNLIRHIYCEHIQNYLKKQKHF